MSTRKTRLHKDLDLLIGAVRSTRPGTAADAAPAESVDVKNGEVLRHIPLEQLKRGKYQPRQDFDPSALEELASSIRHEGVMQPIVIRPVTGDQFEIIAGERRWRAAQLAGLDRIPAIVRDVSDDSAIAMALIENIQRENLNAIEEAQALRRLQVEFELSQQQVAERVGKSRSAIANLLRLLSLEQPVKELVESGQLDMGHAKVLLALEGPLQLKAAKQVLSGGLSVRQTERLVKQLLDDGAPSSKPDVAIDPNIATLQRSLSERLGAAVTINHDPKGRGNLVIRYTNLDELDGILGRIR